MSVCINITHSFVLSQETNLNRNQVRDALRDMNIETRIEGLRREPTMFVENLSDEDGESFDNLIGALIEDSEVQVIYHNRAGLDSRISAS